MMFLTRIIFIFSLLSSLMVQSAEYKKAKPWTSLLDYYNKNGKVFPTCFDTIKKEKSNLKDASCNELSSKENKEKTLEKYKGFFTKRLQSQIKQLRAIVNRCTSMDIVNKDSECSQIFFGINQKGKRLLTCSSNPKDENYLEDCDKFFQRASYESYNLNLLRQKPELVALLMGDNEYGLMAMFLRDYPRYTESKDIEEIARSFAEDNRDKGGKLIFNSDFASDLSLMLKDGIPSSSEKFEGVSNNGMAIMFLQELVKEEQEVLLNFCLAGRVGGVRGQTLCQKIKPSITDYQDAIKPYLKKGVNGAANTFDRTGKGLGSDASILDVGEYAVRGFYFPERQSQSHWRFLCKDFNESVKEFTGDDLKSVLNEQFQAGHPCVRGAGEIEIASGEGGFGFKLNQEFQGSLTSYIANKRAAYAKGLATINSLLQGTSTSMKPSMWEELPSYYRPTVAKIASHFSENSSKLPSDLSLVFEYIGENREEILNSEAQKQLFLDLQKQLVLNLAKNSIKSVKIVQLDETLEKVRSLDPSSDEMKSLVHYSSITNDFIESLDPVNSCDCKALYSTRMNSDKGQWLEDSFVFALDISCIGVGIVAGGASATVTGAGGAVVGSLVAGGCGASVNGIDYWLDRKMRIFNEQVLESEKGIEFNPEALERMKFLRNQEFMAQIGVAASVIGDGISAGIALSPLLKATARVGGKVKIAEGLAKKTSQRIGAKSGAEFLEKSPLEFLDFLKNDRVMAAQWRKIASENPELMDELLIISLEKNPDKLMSDFASILKNDLSASDISRLQKALTRCSK